MNTHHLQQIESSLGAEHFTKSAIEHASPPQTLEEISNSIQRIFPDLTPTERLHFLIETSSLPLVATTSGGIHSATLLSLIAAPYRINLDSKVEDRLKRVPLVFIDTGDIFPETHAYLKYLSAALDLPIEQYRHALTPTEFEHNIDLLIQSGYSGSEAFDELSKVRPMQQIIQDLGAKVWVSGNRRDQSPSRHELPFAEVKNGLVKVYPLANLTEEASRQVLEEHGLEPHPLAGTYRSVGNKSDTLVTADKHEKSGRHNGERDECGLHLGWVRRGRTLVLVDDHFVPAPRFPLVHEVIKPTRS